MIHSHSHSISSCIFKKPDPFFQECKGNNRIDRVIDLFFNFYSVKQTVRPDSILDCAVEAFPSIKHFLTLQFSRVIHVIKNVCIIESCEFYEDLKALEILSTIEKSIMEKKEIQISLVEKESLSTFFVTISNCPEHLSRLEDWLTLTRQSAEIFKAFKSCKDLMKVVSEDIVDILDKKLKSIELFLNSSNTTLEDKFKLQPLDYRLIFLAPSKKILLDKLQEIGVQCNRFKQLDAKWSKLKEWNMSSTIKDLRQLALNDLKSGSVFFGHRFTFSKIRDEQLNIVGAMKNILIGSLNHVAIFTKGEKSIYYLSCRSAGREAHS